MGTKALLVVVHKKGQCKGGASNAWQHGGKYPKTVFLSLSITFEQWTSRPGLEFSLIVLQFKLRRVFRMTYLAEGWQYRMSGCNISTSGFELIGLF